MTMVLITLIKFLIIMCASSSSLVSAFTSMYDNIANFGMYSLTNYFSCTCCNKIKLERERNMNMKIAKHHRNLTFVEVAFFAALVFDSFN